MLDRYAQPENDPARLAERREVLTDQLAWLADEAEALAPLLADLPEWAVSETALPGERSVRAALARIAALDAGPRYAWLRALAAAPAGAAPALQGDEPVLDAADVAARSLRELLADVRSARTALLERLAGLSESVWAAEATLDGEPATLYDVTLRIARDDADELRAIAYRLHEATVGGSLGGGR